MQQAFKMICMDKMLSDGYFDMSIYIYARIKKDEMYAKLSEHKSKYAALYKGTYPKKDNAVSMWYSKIQKPERNYDIQNVILTYEEASAIVNWVYRTLNSSPERERFTQEVLRKLKEFHDIENDVRLSRGVVYNAAKIDLHFFSSVYDVSSFISSIKKSDDTLILFRGHANPNYTLLPSIMRTANLRENESVLYNELLINCPEEFEKCHTHLETLVKMQHYGLPTRLLDITKNLLVALFFACESHPESYAELILIAANRQEIKYPQSDTVSILASLPLLSAQKQQYFLSLANDPNVTTKRFNDAITGWIHEIRLEKPAFKAAINKDDVLDSYIVYALKSNSRIVKQDGAFILCGLNNRSGFLEKYRFRQQGKKVVILIDNKKRILEQLDTLSINRASLFPEIECVSEYLKNKYS